MLGGQESKLWTLELGHEISLGKYLLLGKLSLERQWHDVNLDLQVATLLFCLPGLLRWKDLMKSNYAIGLFFFHVFGVFLCVCEGKQGTQPPRQQGKQGTEYRKKRQGQSTVMCKQKEEQHWELSSASAGVAGSGCLPRGSSSVWAVFLW